MDTERRILRCEVLHFSTPSLGVPRTTTLTFCSESASVKLLYGVADSRRLSFLVTSKRDRCASRTHTRGTCVHCSILFRPSASPRKWSSSQSWCSSENHQYISRPVNHCTPYCRNGRSGPGCWASSQTRVRGLYLMARLEHLLYHVGRGWHRVPA